MRTYKSEFIKGVLYTSVSKYVGIFISIIISSILARLLCPEDFGVIALASIIIAFVNLMTDLGFGPAIIQIEELDDKDLGGLFSLTFLIGGICALLLYCFADIIADYYNNEILIGVIQFLSINIVFAGLNIVPNALLLKRKQFKLIAIRTLVMQVVAGLFAILMALKGYGVYSLVFQSILSSLGIFIFNYCKNPIGFFSPIYRSSIKKVFNFSLFQFLSSLINYVEKTLDKPLVGKFLDLNMLGYYEKSYRLMMLPVNNLSYVFTPVMQPMFREFRNNMKDMCQKYLVMLKCIACIAFPLSAFLYFSAGDLIYLFYGNQWDLAVPPFRNLSLSVGFLVLLATTGPIYQSSNNVRIMFVNTVIEAIIAITCMLLGFQIGGIDNVALMVSIGVLIRFFFIYIVLFSKVFHAPIVKLFCAIKEAFLLSFAYIIIFYAISNCIFSDSTSILRLGVSSCLLLALVVGILLKFRLLKLKR